MTAGASFTQQLGSLSTLGQIGLGVSAFSTAMGIGSAYFTAETQKAVLEGQAKLSALNAKMAEFSASQTIAEGKKQEEAYLMQAGALKSKTKTTYANRGFLQSGTVSDVLTSQDIVKQIERVGIEKRALDQAFGLKSQAFNQMSQAINQKFSAESISPFASTLSAGLQGTSNMFTQFALLQSLGTSNIFTQFALLQSLGK
jgi:hypothetical protein